jgi:hypothetical protein
VTNWDNVCGKPLQTDSSIENGKVYITKLRNLFTKNCDVMISRLDRFVLYEVKFQKLVKKV